MMCLFYFSYVTGTDICPQNWILQYSGFVMSTYYSSQYRGEFVCVDRHAKTSAGLSGSHGNLYTTEIECGNLPCPRPFVQDREVTCAVCSAYNQSGTVYTHWGRDSCGDNQNIQTLYHGIAAGSNNGHSGSGANALCLTENVHYTYYSDSNQDGALLYGIQYQSGLGLQNHNDVNQHLAACSVCFVPERQSHVIIPGTTFCPSRWKPLYFGYMYASYYSHNKANWVCVDEHPVSLAFPKAGQSSWYPTQIQCGSISCSNTRGSYVQNREVACIVCQPDTTRRSVVYTRWGRSDCPAHSRMVLDCFSFTHS